MLHTVEYREFLKGIIEAMFVEGNAAAAVTQAQGAVHLGLLYTSNSLVLPCYPLLTKRKRRQLAVLNHVASYKGTRPLLEHFT